MRTQKVILNCFIVSLFFSACTNEERDKKIIGSGTAIKWLSGCYKMKSKYGDYTEYWVNKDSTSFTGLGYFLDSETQDTLFRQSMKLEQTLDGVFMYFNVKNQNDDKDVEFRLTKQENKRFTFENPFRDYPSIITYKILNDTAVNVVMYGFKNGEERNEDFIITK